jgi:hypothetical protein
MQQSGSMSFQCTLDVADLAAGIRHATRRSLLHRLLIGWFVLLTIALGVNAALTHEVGSFLGAIPPIVIVGWLLGGAGIQARSQFKNHKYIGEPGIYEFDTEGFRISRPSLEVKSPWTAVAHVVECKEHYLIYTSKNCFHVVPRRFLPDEQLWRELVAIGLGRPIERG